MENAQRKIQGSGTYSASSAPRAAATGATGGTVQQILSRDYLETALFGLNAVNLVLFIVSLIPFGGVGTAARRAFLIGSIVRFLLFLYQQHGVPQFNMQYAQTLLMDASAPVSVMHSAYCTFQHAYIDFLCFGTLSVPAPGSFYARVPTVLAACAAIVFRAGVPLRHLFLPPCASDERRLRPTTGHNGG